MAKHAVRLESGQAEGLDTNDIETGIKDLYELDLYALQVKWRKLMRKPAPKNLNRHILMRVIAYKMQAQRFGDLDPESVRILDKIAENHYQQRKAGLFKKNAVPDIAAVPRDRGYGEGVVFIREYAGQMHRVIVVRNGFEWQGEAYRSLSQIAQRITGTSWNGPRFFGLREGNQNEDKRRMQKHVGLTQSAAS